MQTFNIPQNLPEHSEYGNIMQNVDQSNILITFSERALIEFPNVGNLTLSWFQLRPQLNEEVTQK